MKPFKTLHAVDQLAAHIRDSILKGELTGDMPGIRRLAVMLGVSSNTVAAAVDQLSREGFIKNKGHGKRSEIVLPQEFATTGFKVCLLPYEQADVQLDEVVEIQQRIKDAGHEVFIADKSLKQLGMNVGRIKKMVEKTEANAWVVFSAPEEVLEWFTNNNIPTFALFGRFRRLNMAATGLNKVPAFRAAIKRLVELGHRRIVLLQPKHNREPKPALLVREALDEMEAQGIMTGPYNLPDWKQSPDGLRKCLDSLFAVTPPSAIIFDRANELIGAQLHLAQKGILAPRDVSLLSDYDPVFEWCKPSVGCIQWESRWKVHRVCRWVANITQGKDDKRQSYHSAKFMEGGTIGPACHTSPRL